MIHSDTKSMLIAVDLTSIVICLLIQFDFGSHTVKIKSYDKKLFNLLVIIAELLLLTDSLSWLVLGIKKYYLMNYIILSIYFSIHLVMCTVWIMYCDYLINKDEQHAKKIRNFLMAPTIIVVILSFISYKYPIMYNLSQDNIYSRGDYYVHFIALCFLLLLYSIFLILRALTKYKKQNNIDKKLFILVIYPSVPILGVVIQSIFYAINIAWTLTAISLLIVYFNFQNTLLMIDPLTGISNRYRFDEFLDRHFYDSTANTVNFLSIIDLNKFKLINDNFGHADGDKILKAVSKILIEETQKTDLVARLGGDEFVVYGERNNEEEILNLKSNINNKVQEYNQMTNNKYNLSLSIGFSLRSKNMQKTKGEMFIEADNNMYKEKCKYHQGLNIKV